MMRATVLTMRSFLVGMLLVAGATSAANAGPTARFGLTFAAKDQGAPGEHELGPMFAVGQRWGSFLVELDYAYLSMMDPDTSEQGVHRFGITLRGDVWREANAACIRRLACTRSR